MWNLVGITILLSRAVIANLNDENTYYLTDLTDDRSLESLEKRPVTTMALRTSKATKLEDYEDEREQEQMESERLRDYSRLVNEPKRTIAQVDLIDGTSGRRQAPAPVATLLYWPDHEDQAIGMENNKNPLIEERRNPSFSPWGGKRDSENYGTIPKLEKPVENTFHSWGGKRSIDRIHSTLKNFKRDKSFSWNGKKSPPFNSWGGKRGSIEYIPKYEMSAKRRYDKEDRRVSRESSKRVKFDDDFGSLRINDRDKSIKNEFEMKRGSLKLIGSDEMTTSGSTRRGNFPGVPFEPWGGKRKGELRFDDDRTSSASISMIFRKIGRSIPWTE